MAATIQIPGFSTLPLLVSQLSLPAVLKCGQSFRWHRFPLTSSLDPSLQPTEEWRLSLADRVVCLRQNPSTLFYRAVFADGASEEDGRTLKWIKDYFQLDIDLHILYNEWSQRDPVFERIKDRFGGIRMLRQDPWENVISFICSQNNHISRISSMVQKLCINFSPKLTDLPSPASTSTPQLTAYHPFPTPYALAHPTTESRLRELGFGYRAKYIQKTAALLCELHGIEDGPGEWLEGLRKVDIETARSELLKLYGVGPKVADCILLMSLDKASVVPVDTHVYQIAVKHYGLRAPYGKPATMSPAIYSNVAKKLSDVWGPYAGWAHSVLFTADLCSFANYGLPSPSPSSNESGTSALTREATPLVKRLKRSPSTFLASPSPSPLKRSKSTAEASPSSLSSLNDADALQKSSEGSTLEGTSHPDNTSELVASEGVTPISTARRRIITRSISSTRQ